jgi:hypothetical protein
MTNVPTGGPEIVEPTTPRDANREFENYAGGVPAEMRRPQRTEPVSSKIIPFGHRHRQFTKEEDDGTDGIKD